MESQILPRKNYDVFFKNQLKNLVVDFQTHQSIISNKLEKIDYNVVHSFVNNYGKHLIQYSDTSMYNFYAIGRISDDVNQSTYVVLEQFISNDYIRWSYLIFVYDLRENYVISSTDLGGFGSPKNIMNYFTSGILFDNQDYIIYNDDLNEYIYNLSGSHITNEVIKADTGIYSLEDALDILSRGEKINSNYNLTDQFSHQYPLVQNFDLSFFQHSNGQLPLNVFYHNIDLDSTIQAKYIGKSDFRLFIVDKLKLQDRHFIIICVNQSNCHDGNEKELNKKYVLASEIDTKGSAKKTVEIARLVSDKYHVIIDYQWAKLSYSKDQWQIITGGFKGIGKNTNFINFFDSK
ncbi:MAG: hypothetical protein ACOZCO_08675 [Bacteroidota bacterium]